MTNNKSKPLVLLLAAMLMGIMSNAQRIYFNFTDGTQQNYTLEDIRKATFTNDVMNLHLTDGTVYSWNLSTIDHYTYNEGLVTSVSDENGSRLTTLQIYPNPTTGQLTVHYTLDARMPVRLEVRDMQGRNVRQMELGTLPAGNYTAQWDGLDSDGKPVAPATYLCCIVTPRVQMSRTFIIR
jgi:hypothetical protein